MVALTAVLFLATALFITATTGAGGWSLLPLAFLGLFIAVDAAITLVNRAVTDEVGPAVLPGLELRDGVPAEFRTLVVVPTLLTSSAAVEELIERLEIHHLAQPGRRYPFRAVVGLDRLDHRKCRRRRVASG